MVDLHNLPHLQLAMAPATSSAVSWPTKDKVALALRRLPMSNLLHRNILFNRQTLVNSSQAHRLDNNQVLSQATNQGLQ